MTEAARAEDQCDYIKKEKKNTFIEKNTNFNLNKIELETMSETESDSERTNDSSLCNSVENAITTLTNNSKIRNVSTTAHDQQELNSNVVTDVTRHK